METLKIIGYIALVSFGLTGVFMVAFDVVRAILKILNEDKELND